MPNWCSTRYYFYSDTETGKAQLEALYKRLEKAIEPRHRRILNSDFGNDWLGNVILELCPQYLKLTSTSVTCSYNNSAIQFRGFIVFMEYSDALIVDTETAWCPMPEMWDMILAECGYTDINYVYQAEEPGNDLYINTDVSGRVFLDKYYVDIFVSNDFWCEILYIQSDEELLHIMNDFIRDLRNEYKTNSQKYSLPEGYKPTGLRKCKSIEQAMRVIRSNLFRSSDGDSYFKVHKYKAG